MNIISLKKPWLSAAMFVLAITSLSSCLKDTGPVQNFGQSPALVGFQYKGSQAIAMINTFPVETEDTVAVEVTLSASSLTLTTPVTVTLELDPDSLAAYNAHNVIADSTCQCYIPYTMLDPSSYTSTPANMQVTIAPGQQIVPLVIHINQPLVDFSTNPILVFKIASASGAEIATNLSVILIPIKLKNPWDGDYAVTGYFNHPAAPRYEDLTKRLSTVSSVRSEGIIGDGTFNFQFDVSPTNTLINWAQPSGAAVPPSGFICCTDNAAGSAGFPGPPFTYTTYNNTYDPATHTFWMHYGYNGTPYTREIYEKWVLQ